MKVTDVKNCKYATVDNKYIECEAMFEDLGDEYLTHVTCENADTEHGIEIWNNAIAGKYGEIEEFKEVALTNEQIEAKRERLYMFHVKPLLRQAEIADLEGTQSATIRLQAREKWEQIKNENPLF